MMAAVTIIRLVLKKNINYKSSPMKPLDLIKHVFLSTNRIKPKTMKVVFNASLLSTQYLGVRAKNARL